MHIAHAEDSSQASNAIRAGSGIRRCWRGDEDHPTISAVIRTPIGRPGRAAPPAQFRPDPHVPGRRSAKLRQGQMVRSGRIAISPRARPMDRSMQMSACAYRPEHHAARNGRTANAILMSRGRPRRSHERSASARFGEAPCGSRSRAASHAPGP